MKRRSFFDVLVAAALTLAVAQMGLMAFWSRADALLTQKQWDQIGMLCFGDPEVVRLINEAEHDARVTREEYLRIIEAAGLEEVR